MSKIENPKKVLKKTIEDSVCDENALKSEKITQKSVTIIFYIFLIHIIYLVLIKIIYFHHQLTLNKENHQI